MSASHFVQAALLLVGTALAQAARAQPASSDTADAAIFRAVVTDLARSAEGVFLVDPREVHAGADLTVVEPAEVGPVSAVRVEVLRQLGIESTAFLSDQPCAFAHGLPPAPDKEILSESDRVVRQQCRQRGPFTSAIIGRPRPSSTDDRDTVTVIVVRITTSSYSVREYVFRRGSGGWQVIRTEELLGVQS